MVGKSIWWKSISGCLFRLVPGLWFGVIVALTVLAKLIGNYPIGTFSVYAWLTVLVPAMVGALFGALLGRAILRRSDPVPWLLAMLRGFGIASISAITYVITLALVGTISEPDKSINRFLSLIFFMSLYLGVPMFLITLIVGSLSGVTLYVIAQATSDLCPPRASNH